MTPSTLWTFLESLARETGDPGASVMFRREDASLRIDVRWFQNGRTSSYAHLLDVTDVLNGYVLTDMQQQAMLRKIRAHLDRVAG